MRALLSYYAVAALLITVLLFPSYATAQADPFGGAAIGGGLAKLGDKVNEAVEKAIGGGLIMEVQAGGQVSLLIQQAQTTFENEKSLTFAQLNGEQQAVVNSIWSVSNDFLTKANADMSDITKRAIAATHNLPFSKTLPQAWKIEPYYFEQVADHPLRVTVSGDFYNIAEKGMNPVLNVGSKSYSDSTKDSTAISFDIPMKELSGDANKPIENKLTVTVPYEESCWLFFHCKKEALFKASAVALPQKLGDVLVNITTTSPGIAQQPVVSPEFAQESGDDDIKCGGEHGDQAVHIAYPDSGWRVVPSSVTWQITWSQGHEGVDNDFWLAQNCSSGTTACLCVSTEHHRFGTSGKVHFRIKFTEEKDITNSETVTTPVKVGWGESRVLSIPAGATWTGQYTRFDGKVQQFAGPYDDSFLRVTQTGGVLTLATAPFGVPTPQLAAAQRQITNEKASAPGR
jgi:hypothetical protein